MPGRFAWVQYDFTPEAVAEMLQEAKVPGAPDYADLKTAASRLNDLASAIGEPAPPRPESLAAWCEETAAAADVLLRRFGADPAWIARGSAVLPAEARAVGEIQRIAPGFWRCMAPRLTATQRGGKPAFRKARCPAGRKTPLKCCPIVPPLGNGTVGHPPAML
jgi:hypothetical protein